jgi:hypothetical protein
MGMGAWDVTGDNDDGPREQNVHILPSAIILHASKKKHTQKMKVGVETLPSASFVSIYSKRTVSNCPFPLSSSSCKLYLQPAR